MLKGWDFEELADEWGLYLPDYLDGSNDLSSVNWIKMYLENFTWGDKRTRIRRKIANDIREHCRLMVDYECFDESAIWEGFTKVENDYTLINYFIPLVGFAWT